MEKKINKNNKNIFYNNIYLIVTFLTVLTFKILIELSYVFVISKDWAYTRLLLDINIYKLIESYMLFFVLFVFLPKSNRYVSNIFCSFFYLISYIPLLSLYALMDQSRLFIYAVSIFWSVIFLSLRLPLMHIKPLKDSNKLFFRYFIFICLTIYSLYIIYRFFSFKLIFSFKNVYEIRKNFSKVNVPFMIYIFIWMTNVIIPFFYANSLIKKRFLLAFVLFLLQFLFFSISGHKAYFFTIIFVTAVIFIIDRKIPLFYFSIGLLFIVAAGIISRLFFNNILISSLFTRRFLFVPAQLTFYYYDFFSENSFVYLSHSIFKTFFKYPYSLPPTHLIAQIYFNNPEINANTGIIADSFMNFGFTGMFLCTVIVVFLFKLTDSLLINKEKKIGIAAVIMPVLIMTNAAILTTILTHGFMIALIILYLFPEKDSVEYRLKII
ncbi:MAG: oligosaccharide repeat unit polymerase [Spirochaetes bacterium]|nr:oligosaccharide repeat unit polymerase [Spirochaetota bacterium]